VRIAFGIEYDGTAYVGWQRQQSGTGVQALVEAAICKVANEPVTAVCAGRTDAGVHATAQVIHADTGAERSARDWVLGVNSNLPDDINVTWAAAVDKEFHARFSATSRSYRYLILNQAVRSSLCHRRAWWVYDQLDENAMQAGADLLLGRHDFSAFRAARCQASAPVRELTQLAVTRRQNLVTITVTANAFLQHMVRNITGLLVAIGRGEQEPGWAGTVLQGCDRTRGGMAAPARGLTLIGVDYPQRFGIPPNVRSDIPLHV
jgi:tRNA pseudouridine38-40 synthase